MQFYREHFLILIVFFWGYELHNFNEYLLRLSVAIFFASKAGKKGFPLLSAIPSADEYLFSFYKSEEDVLFNVFFVNLNHVTNTSKRKYRNNSFT
jgi:hypothetical protein